MMTSLMEQAHSNMVLHQVRGWDVVDPRVLETLSAIPREDFVPANWRKLAFADIAIPLAHGQAMMKPVVEGRMLQALQVQPHEHVLEIGTGTGFITACLAHMGAHVTSIDLHADFTASAGKTLQALDITNVTLLTGEAVEKWHPDRHFDAIAVTGAVAEIPSRWQDWLASEGRLFVVHGHPPIQCASLLRNSATGGLARESLFDTWLPYLEFAEPQPVFA